MSEAFIAGWPGAPAVAAARDALVAKGVEIEVMAVHGDALRCLTVFEGIPVYASPLVEPGELLMGRYADVLTSDADQIAAAVAEHA